MRRIDGERGVFRPADDELTAQGNDIVLEGEGASYPLKLEAVSTVSGRWSSGSATLAGSVSEGGSRSWVSHALAEGDDELFVVAAGRAVPDLKTAKVRQRTSLAIFSMISALAGSDLAAYGQPLTTDGLDPQWLDQLIEFTCGGLRGDNP